MGGLKNSKNKQIVVQDVSINVATMNGTDYICLTDMVRNIGGSAIIEKWMRSKNTIEYLGVWETLNNPVFNSLEFEGIKNQAGSNRFVLSAKQWVDLTGAIGVNARAGRYGGTYAHADIAFEFATWVSPEFRFLVIKEFQRLKAKEQENVGWDYHRFLAKVNYRLQTNAVKETLIPTSDVAADKSRYLYAEEADIVNVAVFGMTAQEWRKANQSLAKKSENIRDHANIEQLTVIANLESLNSMLISNQVQKPDRLSLLQLEARRQLSALIPLSSQLNPPTTLPIKGIIS